MLSTHYVSIMMPIFYIDWQQHWGCHRTVNIGDQQNSHKLRTSVEPWQLGFQWHRRGIELVFKSLDCFTKRLFHTATFFFAATYVFVVWNFTRLITRLKRFFFFFFNLDLVGEHSWCSSNVFTICAVYRSLGRRGYFGVSNVVLVPSTAAFICLFPITL